MAERGYAETSGKDVATHARVDLSDGRNAAFCSQLEHNDYLVVRKCQGGVVLRRKNPLGVTDAATLRALFTVHIPQNRSFTRAGLVREGVAESELRGAYPGVDADVHAMLARREICRVGDDKEGTLFPWPVGCPADPFLQDLWRSIEAPRARSRIV